MTQDEIYEMVKQSDLGFLLGDNWMMQHELEAFAKLVAQAEREACAKVIENYPAWLGKTAKTEISNAIRARGEA